MPKTIQISDKKPLSITISKKKMIIGKWATTFFLPEKTPIEKKYELSKKRIKEIRENWEKIKKKNLQKTPEGIRTLTEFYKQATNHSELYWKICCEKMSKEKGKNEKLENEMKKAEKDFNYFWKEYEKYKNIGKKKPLTVSEQKVKQALIKVRQSKQEVQQIEKTYGKKSWQVKYKTIEYFENLKEYLSAESANLRNTIEKFPENKKILLQSIDIIEQEFKKTTKRIEIIKKSL